LKTRHIAGLAEPVLPEFTVGFLFGQVVDMGVAALHEGGTGLQPLICFWEPFPRALP
jgi:hypothetical protein